MYAIETAKLSTKGQLVMPDSFRKRYGFKAGMTLLLIGTADSVVVQPLTIPDDSSIDQVVGESRNAATSVADRLSAAKAALKRLHSLKIRMPVGFEDAIVAAAAASSKCGRIVTRNTRHFRKSPIRAETPRQYLNSSWQCTDS